ncbi:MAG: methylated-DNA--[protein]-cysteine S-methyltransferase [Nonlabens sp.]|uniref:methylated-DNA--[protein]-cysteine S-methyltransferase n=1 Tax=Nonlabens sp. TaxID=1888209 RepID=UPI003EFB2C4F
MSNIDITYYKSPVGELIIGVFKDQLCILDWRYRKQRSAVDSRIEKTLEATIIEHKHPLQEILCTQLEEYFKGQRCEFDIPILLAGTDFQKQVWNQLMKIPYGETITYLTLSRKLDNEKAIRAVASANGANALSIIIPCHRVIASNGDLTGYAGGLPAKKKLLQIEGALNNEQLELF